jgi:hypothetical protein
MRTLGSIAVFLGLGMVVVGCGPRKSFDGPTVDAFTGRLTHDGRPVTFTEGETVSLDVYHETGRHFGIPIQSDGSFKIGWMPIGKYSATLMRGKTEGRGPPASRYNVPGGLTIEEGKTEYAIELGKGWKP